MSPSAPRHRRRRKREHEKYGLTSSQWGELGPIIAGLPRLDQKRLAGFASRRRYRDTPSTTTRVIIGHKGPGIAAILSVEDGSSAARIITDHGEPAVIALNRFGAHALDAIRAHKKPAAEIFATASTLGEAQARLGQYVRQRLEQRRGRHKKK